MVIIGFSGDERQSQNTRTEADVLRVDAPSPAQAEAGLGEQVQPVLEPGLAAVESNFGQQMEALKSELTATLTEDQRDEIQQRMQSLKIEWTLALANREFELARQKQDSKAEAEILQAISQITNPTPHEQTPVARDPKAGIVTAGGAK